MTKVMKLVGVMILMAACAKDGAEAGGSAKGGPPAAIELTALGLKGEGPAGSKADKAPIGDGLMVQGPDLVANVEVASESRSKTLDDDKKDAEMYSPKNPKEETLPDGWAYTYENKGGMGTNYFVHVRRDIGGKAIWCETTASSAAQQANALAFCKSLK